MDRIVLRYRDHAFVFERAETHRYDGRLVLNDHDRQLLAMLTAAEPDDWCMDNNGERLPAEELFARTPWTYSGPQGPVKLLCRFLWQDEARFETIESYAGELFDWVRFGCGPEAP